MLENFVSLVYEIKNCESVNLGKTPFLKRWTRNLQWRRAGIELRGRWIALSLLSRSRDKISWTQYISSIWYAAKIQYILEINLNNYGFKLAENKIGISWYTGFLMHKALLDVIVDRLEIDRSGKIWISNMKIRYGG